MVRPPTKAKLVADLLSKEIQSGRYSVGDWLPAERELAETYGVDRSTVRRALQLLAGTGSIKLVPGVGSQVEERLQRQAVDITKRTGQWRGFHVSAQASGKEPYTKVEIRDVEANTDVSKWLGVPSGTLVLERRRIQGVSGSPPMQVSTTWIAPDITERLPGLRQVNTGPGGMLSRIEELGLVLRFEDIVRCRLPSSDEQKTLQLGDHDPVLDVWRRCYDQDGRIVEATRRVIAGNRHELAYRY